MIITGEVFDGERFIGTKTIVIEGRIIKEVKSPEGESQGIILPGLIDAHVHFFGVKEDKLLTWNITPEGLSVARSFKDMINLLAAGFTAVRDLGSKSAIFLSKAEKEGYIPGPRVIASGYSLAETGGNDDPVDLPIDMAQRLSYSFYCDSPWECRKAVRLAIRQGAEVIKIYASGAFSQGGYPKPSMTVEDIKAIVDEAHRAGLKVASHAYGEEAISNSIEGGVDSIEHGLGLTEELAEEIKKKGIFYVPTLATYAKELRIREMEEEVAAKRKALIDKHLKEDVKIAAEKGVKIVAGTDYVGSPERKHGENYKEIVLLSQFLGLERALLSATSIAADCLGVKMGRIKEGYEANLVLLKKLEAAEDLNPENVIKVVRKGKTYDTKILRSLVE